MQLIELTNIEFLAMKTLVLLKVFFFLFLTTGSLCAQDVIYSQDFNNDIGKGFDGDGLNDLTDVEWTLDVAACTFAGLGDYVKVVATGNDRLEAVDCDGEAIWRSSTIDISTYSDIEVSIFTGETGGGTVADNKYIKLYYSLDGGAEISFFESSVDWTEAIASISGLNGNSLQLVARMNTTYSADKIYIDDVLVTGTSLVVGNDELTLLLEPENQVFIENISSIAIPLNSSQSLLKFKLSEIGSEDGLPTNIASVKFVNSADNNPADLEKQLENVELFSGTNLISTELLTVSSTEIVLNFADGNFSLQDNAIQEYELKAYWKSNEIIDGQSIRLELIANDSGITTYDSGSGFDIPNSVAVSSNEYQFLVVGTELSFNKKPPKTLDPNTNFEMELKLIDKFGNQDLNSTQEAHVSLASGTGDLTSEKGLNVNLVDGIFSWNDLTYNKAENFTLLIEVEDLNSILSDNISSLDANSILIPGQLPVLPQILSSLSIDSENSEDVLNFVVEDFASLDETPTLITSMKFYNTFVDSGLNWKTHLAGAVIKRDGQVIASTDKVDEAIITFSSLDIEILNGSQSEFELGIFFKKSLIPDHAKFQVEIRKDHQWKTSSTGSFLISELSERILSPIHEIDINADRLSFISYPKGIEEFENFMLTIAAVDEYQNIDTDKSSSISLNSESGVLSQTGVVGSLDDGVLVVRDLSFSGNQNLVLTARNDSEFVSQEIFVQESNIIFSDDFESNNLNLWENTDAWTTSSYYSINGDLSLKHNLTNAIGSSSITCTLHDIEVGSESIFWEFVIRNSDWDPTSTNNFIFHLLMDSNDAELAGNLFSVGVNLSGSDDHLSLWKTEGENLDVLVKTDFDWNEEETVAIKVEYNSRGEWLLSYNRLGENSQWLEADIVLSEVDTNVENWYSGLEFNYATASRAGELWFDDLGIETYNTAPYLKSYDVFSDSIVLNYSENLNLVESSKPENFEFFFGEESMPIKEVKSTNLDNQLLIVFEDALVTGNYNLNINQVEDLKGAISETEIIQFYFYEELEVHDLVINEIFADESPVVGLPEYEFVEIYNTSDYPVRLKDFLLTVGSTDKVLDDYELSSDAYLILCSTAAAEFYKAYGNVLAVNSFPSLTNSGTSISLKSSGGTKIDEITYSSDWYADEEKRDGGWSLERIDVNNHSWQADNWQASNDAEGGTPGQVNSVVADNPDNTPPSLLYFEIDLPNSIRLYFSEALKLPQAYLIENYSVDNGLNQPSSIQKIEADKFALKLSFASEFESNVDYLLTLSDQLSDLEGNLFEEREFKFVLADLPKEGDLVINEVLFNPYPNGADYLELLNISDRVIDTKDLFIANRDENYQIDAVYPISDKSRFLEAGSYLLLSSDTANVILNYSNLDEKAFVQLTRMPSYNDDEGRVVILNRDNEQIDDFAYDESMHFSQLTSAEGVSLERINPNKETNSKSNWISASQTANFGTPGIQNSSYDIDEVEVNEIGFKSKIFSPDNDGVDDRLIISFNLEKSGYVANIRVYNSFGREIRRLASNVTLSTNDELFWDGLLANKERAPIGIYAFYFELFHPDGEVKTYKKTCVLGGKFK